MKSNDIATMVLLLSSVLLSGCVTRPPGRVETKATVSPQVEPLQDADDRAAWTTTDTWYRPAEDWSYEEKVRLDRSCVQVVPDSHQSSAQQRLEQVPFVKLDATDLSVYEIPVREPKEGASFYLMRAVFLNAGTGSFLVQRIGTTFLVFHGCLGRHAVPMKRAAIIVETDQTPTDLYTECSMAE